MTSTRYTDEDVVRAVAEAHCLSDVLRALGLRTAGGNHRQLRSRIARLGVSTAHFSTGWRGPRGVARPLEEVMVVGSTYSRGTLKRRLYDAGLKQRVCELCGQDEVWRGRRMSLILDHVNGIADDHRLENLRIVCANCNATLDTHCAKNVRRPVEPRACCRCHREFFARNAGQRYCSRECGQRAPRNRSAQPHRRKVDRPPLEQLLREVDELGWRGAGAKYGVSDNAIRKWVLAYRREAAEAERSSGPTDS